MKTVLMAAAICASITTASAVSAKEPFNGPFVGIQAGWSRDEVGNASSPLGNLAIGNSNDTITGGIFAGYDYKLAPNIVAGAEAGVSLSDSDDLTRKSGGTAASIDAERSIDVTARLGYLVTPNTLLYARGGYSNVRAEAVLTNAIGTRRDRSNLDGWVVGAGSEHMLSEQISTRLEYRYSDLSEGDGKFDRHQLLAGVAYRF